MDKIWYRNPSKSEVIGRCGGDEKTEWPRRTDKSQTLKRKKEKHPEVYLILSANLLNLNYCDKLVHVVNLAYIVTNIMNMTFFK